MNVSRSSTYQSDDKHDRDDYIRDARPEEPHESRPVHLLFPSEELDLDDEGCRPYSSGYQQTE
jgi:hypothetical protein